MATEEGELAGIIYLNVVTKTLKKKADANTLIAKAGRNARRAGMQKKKADADALGAKAGRNARRAGMHRMYKARQV